ARRRPHAGRRPDSTRRGRRRARSWQPRREAEDRGRMVDRARRRPLLETSDDSQVSVRRCPRYSRSGRHLPPTTARAPSSPCLRQRAALPSVLAVGQTPPADYGKGSFVALPASACGAALGVVGVLLLPREQRAQLLADLLDRVLRGLLAERGELRRAGVLVVDEALGERAGLDVREDALHVLLDVRVDHARARDVVAVLRGVGDGPALLGDAALPHEVDDELELVQHLEVRDLRLVAGLGEGLEAVLDELRHATAQDGLLAEEVGLGLLGERRPDDAGARAADRLRVRQRDVPGLARRVLLDGDDVRDAAARDELAAHGVARRLRGDEDDVDALGGLDVAEADVEAVRERERLARGEVRLDLVVVD